MKQTVFLPLVTACSLALSAPAFAQGEFYGLDPQASVEQRMEYRCPPTDPGMTGTPAERYLPDRDNAFLAFFSAESDAVELSGPETELAVDLGSGDDLIIYRNVISTINLTAGAGNDTVILCDMDGVLGLVTLMAGVVMSSIDQDVLIFDAGVFDEIPGGMKRAIQVQFDPTSTTIVIHAQRREWDNEGWIVYGDLSIGLVPPTTWVGDFNAIESIHFRPP